MSDQIDKNLTTERERERELQDSKNYYNKRRTKN